MEKALFKELIQRYRGDEEAQRTLWTALRLSRDGVQVSTINLFVACDISRSIMFDYGPTDAFNDIMDGRVAIADDLAEVLEAAHGIAIQRIRNCFPLRIEQVTVNDLWEALGFPQFKTESAVAA